MLHLLQGLLGQLGNALPAASASARTAAQAVHNLLEHPVTIQLLNSCMTSKTAATSTASDTLSDGSSANVPSLSVTWTSCAQAALQAIVLAPPHAASQPPSSSSSSASASASSTASGRSILQESFWRHSHPQLKARSTAVHPALDWLYPAVAALAALEQALLMPSAAFTYSSQVDGQVRHKMLSLMTYPIVITVTAW